MKHRIRILSLLLAGLMVLSLTSCIGGKETEDAPVSPTPTLEPDSDSILPDDFVVDTSVTDLCLATAGIPGDFELFTVNGVPVTARTYLYWLFGNISYIDSTYSNFSWDSSSSGSSIADSLKQDAVKTAACYSLVTSNAKELGCEMTQEQIDELNSTNALTAMMMGGEAAFEDALRKAGLDSDTLYEINAASYYYQLVLNALYADRPTDEELDAYIEENDILYAKHILLATIDTTTRESLDAATIAEKKATAEDLLARLQASTDLAADFDALMNEYSDDPGLASYPDGYTFTANQMYESFETATRALEFGQISGLVESEAGYHIILRLDPATDSTRQQYRADLMDDQMLTWLNEAEIVYTDEYQALDPELFYAKYTAYQEAFAAEASADPSETPSADPSPDAADPQEN